MVKGGKEPKAGAELVVSGISYKTKVGLDLFLNIKFKGLFIVYFN